MFTILFAAVTCVKFANDEKYLLAFSSASGRIAICSLHPSPRVIRKLDRHMNEVTGQFNFYAFSLCQNVGIMTSFYSNRTGYSIYPVAVN